MSFEHRNAIVAILASFISWGLMITILGQNTLAGTYDGPLGPQAWARSVLWLILISIGIAIVMTILFNIGYAMLTGDKDLSVGLDGLHLGSAAQLPAQARHWDHLDAGQRPVPAEHSEPCLRGFITRHC